jgi:ATP-dependent Zn protease
MLMEPPVRSWQAEQGAEMPIENLANTEVLEHHRADVGHLRERSRRFRLTRIAAFLALPAAYLWLRWLNGDPVGFGMPSLPFAPEYLPAFFLVLILVLAIGAPLLGAGRSPHVLYRPSEIDIGLDDVKGAGTIKDEVIKTLNLFLAFRTFREEMGGTPRRAILFEGPPGTGKTYMAKAMAAEASVPFLFVSSSAFQSMYYGQTNRKIRSYFRALRKAAREEGGAIGFIEEIDAIGASRSGMGGSGGREGVAGVVNELLIQLQSFDEPPAGTRFKNFWIERINRLLPTNRQFRKLRAPSANVLVVGATNRASDLDVALTRPGRFDRVVHFGLPNRSARREIIDFYLDRKSHTEVLDRGNRREQLAVMTAGYSPVMIEHLFDEALVWALRRGADSLGWDDIQQAKLTEEVGLREPVDYTPDERRRIATHEAGHATVAYLVGKDRKLDILSIVKRRDALGMLGHSDREERFTKNRSEVEALIQIAMGGMVAEERYFGEAGTGPAGDLQAATQAAAHMVGAYGMAGSLISWEAAQVPGAGNLVAKVLADEKSRETVNDILSGAKAEVEKMLAANGAIVEALRDALLDREELVGEEITAVIEMALGSGVELPDEAFTVD